MAPTPSPVRPATVKQAKESSPARSIGAGRAHPTRGIQGAARARRGPVAGARSDGAPPFEHSGFRGLIGRSVDTAEGSASKGGRTPLYELSLPDGHRLGVLLQIASAIAHAQLRGGKVLGADHPRPFQDAWIDEEGVVGGLCFSVGHDSELTQAVLRRTAIALFEAESSIAGRGRTRRAARSLLGAWEETFCEQPAASSVGRILRSASFLWSKTYRRHRVALVAHHRREETDVDDFLWVVGGAAFRERLLARCSTLSELQVLVQSEGVMSLWWDRTLDTASKALMSPSDLVAEGYWSAALARWKKTPPTTPVEKLACADSLHALGQFEEALELARGNAGKSWSLLRMRCAYELGELNSASRELSSLLSREVDWQDFSVDERLGLLDVAIRVRSNLGDWEGVRDWVQRCLRWRGGGAVYGRILAAEGCWDLGDLKATKAHLERAVELDPEAPEFWRYQRILALYHLQAGDAAAARRAQEEVLKLGRRGMRVSEAGRAWSDVVLGRTLDGDLAGAERACRHAMRLLRQCQGPVHATLVAGNFAEIRIRRGRLRGVRGNLKKTIRTNELSGNRRAVLVDQALLGRFLLASGELTRAEQILRSVVDALEDSERGGGLGAEVQLLLARCLGWLGRRAAAHRSLLLAGGWEEMPKDAGTVLSGLPEGVCESEEFPALFAHAGVCTLALDLAHRLGLSHLWNSNRVDGTSSVTALDWHEALKKMEPYRAARWVFDLRLAGAGMDEEVIRMAADELSVSGARGLADLLSGHLDDSWQAAHRFLQLEQHGEDAIRAIFHSGGAAGVRVELIRGGEPQIVVPGPGGSDVVEVEGQGIQWSFHFDELSKRLEAVAHLVAATAKLEHAGLADDTAHGDADALLPEGVVGQSPALVQAYRHLTRFGKSEMTLLILGESGTGKERAARAAHEASPRSSKPFLPINCAAVDQNLALSDLFGHVKGAFTGADQSRRGVFEEANGGTVLLDEIGDLSLNAQGLLLRLLQEGEIRRLGESKTRPVDVRVIAATHRDLVAQVGDGTFRQDLLYRLNTGTITLPPLRERQGDALLLADAFLEELGKPGQLLAPSARAAIAHYQWPGNVRELRNQIQRACALTEGVVETEHLGLEPDESPSAGWHEWLEAVKRERLLSELERHGGNQSATARSLGLTRQALSYLVRQLKKSQ